MNTVVTNKHSRLSYVYEDCGIDFPHDEPAAPSDFGCMALAVRISFAVSECEPTGAAWAGPPGTP